MSKIQRTVYQCVIKGKNSDWYYPYTSLSPLRQWEKFTDEVGEEWTVVKVEELTTYYE